MAGEPLEEASAAQSTPDARRSERSVADEPSTLRGPDGRPVDVHVHDISRHGFLCEADLDLAPGEEVTLGLGPNGSGSAVVRWRDGLLYGCEFVPPIERMDVIRLSGELVGFRRAAAPVPPPRFAVAGPDRLVGSSPWNSTLALTLSTSFLIASAAGTLHLAGVL